MPQNDAGPKKSKRLYLIDNEPSQSQRHVPAPVSHPSPNFRTTSLNVSLEFEGKQSSKTLFKNKRVTYDVDGAILLAPLLD